MRIIEAKNHCKLFKEKFEKFDIKNQILISSKIGCNKIGKTGLNYKNWENIKYRVYFISRCYPNGDISLIKEFKENRVDLCKKYNLKSKFFVNFE